MVLLIHCTHFSSKSICIIFLFCVFFFLVLFCLFLQKVLGVLSFMKPFFFWLGVLSVNNPFTFLLYVTLKNFHLHWNGIIFGRNQFLLLFIVHLEFWIWYFACRTYSCSFFFFYYFALTFLACKLNGSIVARVKH